MKKGMRSTWMIGAQVWSGTMMIMTLSQNLVNTMKKTVLQ